MNINEKGNKSSVARRFVCRTPKEHCTGNEAKMSAGVYGVKSHDSPEACYKCEMRYWTKIGYTYIGGRMMKKEGFPIVVLPRKMKATILRPGKEGRNMPRGKNSRGFIR